MGLIIKINKEIVGEYPLAATDTFSVEYVHSETEVKRIRFEKEQAMFEYFRKAYPGKKRGLGTEFKNFTDKHKKDWQIELPKLYAAVIHEKEEKVKEKFRNGWTAEWPMLQVWINNRRWEMNTEEKETPVLPITVNFNHDGL